MRKSLRDSRVSPAYYKINYIIYNILYRLKYYYEKYDLNYIL